VVFYTCLTLYLFVKCMGALSSVVVLHFLYVGRNVGLAVISPLAPVD